MSKRRVVLSWSSGKDSAWCLHLLRQDPQIEVAGLLTSFNAEAGRVAMHAVRRELVQRQAQLAGLPLFPVELPYPCPNGAYEEAMKTAVAGLRTELSIDAVAFGDLFLEDIRDYREALLADTGLTASFPLWGMDTRQLADDMLDGGLHAVITCVDPAQCPEAIAGKEYTRALLASLPSTADPCGENGEFHTFVHGGPMFSESIHLVRGNSVSRDGFVFTDFRPAATN
ncbi:MAG: ATP-binding protein [Pseudomonadota bacterium]